MPMMDRVPSPPLEPPEDDDGLVRCIECAHLHGLGSLMGGCPVAYCDARDECIDKATYDLPRREVCDCWDEPPVHWGAR